MRVTLEVSQPERSREVSFEQPENMEDISVADEASRPERSIVSAAESPEKRPYRDPDALTPGAMRTEATSAP